MYRLSAAFLLLSFLFIMPANAQFSKGMRMVGADLAGAFFNATTYTFTVPAPTNGYSEKINTLGANLSPDFGWFISDHTVVGGQFLLGYKYNKDLKLDVYDVTFSKNIVKTFNVGIGGFVRHYLPLAGSFYPYGQAGFQVGIASANNEGFYYNNAPLYKDVFKGKGSGDFSANAGIQLGVTRMINAHTGLDISFGYLYSYNKNQYVIHTNRDTDIDGTIDERPTSDVTTKFTNHGLTLGVGFQIFLDKKKAASH